MAVRTRYITPPDALKVLFPYRRVWFSLAIEMGVLFALVAMFYILGRVAGVVLAGTARSILNVVLALAPAALWAVFSLLSEYRVEQPRRQLFVVFAITALAANAISLLLIEDVFQVSRWLPFEGAFNRILGYAFTVGVTQEVTKYLVIRYVAWRRHFRTRYDGVAYSAASAIGYATVLNLHTAALPIQPDVAMMTIFNDTAMCVAASLIVGYGLSEIRFSRPTPFLMPLSIVLAALLVGLATALRSGLVNAGFTLAGADATLILGAAFSAGFVFASAVVIAFLLSVVERRELQAQRAED